MSALAGVLGFPVGHSRSPAMMNAAFRELGLDWRYLRLPLPPERFEQAVRALPGSGYRGANVTIPHKVAAHDLADELSDSARAIGAVNTLTFADGGGIAGDNTDAGGLLDAIGEPVSGTALVLGAGGAARAAAWALAQAGAEVTRLEPHVRARRRARGRPRGRPLGAPRPVRAARERHLRRPARRRHARRAAARRRAAWWWTSSTAPR